jgi:integrase/recombinase XerD
MGRHPFLTAARKYLGTVGPMYAEATVKELDRRTRRMAKDFEALKTEKRIGTTDLGRMTQRDISAYIGLLRTRGLAESGQVHDISTLRALLRFCGNPVLDRMKATHGHMLPKRRDARLPPVSQSVVDRILRMASKADSWPKLQAYALVLMALGGGLRTKELRLARINDLDVNEWVFTVQHPKGEGRYGAVRGVPIRPQVRPTTRRYVAARAEMVSRYTPNNEALFPTLQNQGGDAFHSTDGLECLKKIVEKEVGARFDLRACRRTFGQSCIDDKASLDSVSLLMGHGSTKTTERYYCRKREEVARKEIMDIWQSENRQGAKTYLIENDKYMSGYA